MSTIVRPSRRQAVLAIGATAMAPLPPARAASGIGGPFALAGLDGEPVTDASFRGTWLVVYFGYTSCPDVCPAVLSELGVALADLGPLAAKVRVAFVTLDPVRDTAGRMRDYLSSFDSRIVGLRGTGDEIEAAARAFHVYYRARSLGGGAYAVDHSSFLYVMRPDGGFAALLTGDMPGHRLADTLRRLAR